MKITKEGMENKNSIKINSKGSKLKEVNQKGKTDNFNSL